MRGKFITLEGIEGVGKTTHMDFVTGLLARQGRTVVATREPGGTPAGEAIRGVLLDNGLAGMDPDTELLLMFAARAEHVARVIRPALARGEWVVCDRFTDATYAYQGSGRGVAAARIRALEDWVQQGLRPDLTLLFDVPVEVGLARARGRSARDRFESETVGFFERVRAGYLGLADREPERFRVIDADADIESVRAGIRAALEAGAAERRA